MSCKDSGVTAQRGKYGEARNENIADLLRGTPALARRDSAGLSGPADGVFFVDGKSDGQLFKVISELVASGEASRKGGAGPTISPTKPLLEQSHAREILAMNARFSEDA